MNSSASIAGSVPPAPLGSPLTATSDRADRAGCPVAGFDFSRDVFHDVVRSMPAVRPFAPLYGPLSPSPARSLVDVVRSLVLVDAANVPALDDATAIMSPVAVAGPRPGDVA